MDIKDLNKPQLIMLALLLSFVTSIATGITTVTLMQQAPTSVTIPINRVVRETVEKIVPVPGKNTVQTIVIKEEDLVVDAISKGKGAIFYITKEAKDLDGKDIEADAGIGFAVSKEGIIVADGSLVSPDGVYYVKNDSGKFKANFVSIPSSDPTLKKEFSLLKIGTPLDEKDKVAFIVPLFGDLSKMKIGQKILVLGNTISSFIFEGKESTGKDIKISVAKTNGGAMALNLDGEVLGIVLSGETSSFASIDSISETLKSIETASKTNTN